MYVTEIKEKQIFERIRWQLRIFESVFYKSLIRACSFGNFLAASQNARSNGQTSNHRHCEFVKNALKKCSCLPPGFFQIFVFLLFLSHTPEVYSNHNTVYMLYGIGIYNNQRFVQNMSKIPPHRFRLLIYFLSYTRNLQLANLQIKISSSDS